jgi:carboxypeptidase Taq
MTSAVHHSDFWRDSGFGPDGENGENTEESLNQIARKIMISEMMQDALEQDLEKLDKFSDERQANIQRIKAEKQRLLRRKDAQKEAQKIDDLVYGNEGTKNKWIKAKEQNNYLIVKEDFRKLVEAERNWAKKVTELEDKDAEPYEILLEEYEPHIDIEKVDRIFEELKHRINEILEEIDIPEDQPKLSEFENLSELVDKPAEIHREIVFDLLKGDQESILVKEGPYGMERGDAIMSGMNVNSDQPWPKAFGTTIHEFGHVDYRTYLPDRYVFTPLGEAASDTVDESTARIWQTHIGYSWEFAEQVSEIAERHGIDADPERVHKAFNAVDLNNTSRINADELTYHLHIIVRYEIERELINGSLEVDELEDAWDRKMSEYLPRYDPDIPVSKKFLQDVHWAKGKFGYFPTYSLGTLAATQIFQTAEEAIEDLDQKIDDGNYEALSEWLGDNFYSYGRQYDTGELIEKTSGQEFSAEPFLEYVEEKYRQIY